MNTGRRPRHTDLFLLRVWTRPSGDGGDGTEWRGKVQRVVDGEAHQFDGWQALVETLLSMLPERSGASGGTLPTRQQETDEHTERSER